MARHRSRLRRAAVAAATFAPLALPGLQPPAAAVENVGSFVGTGSYSPGLSATGCAAQSVAFDGTLVLAGTAAGVYPVSFRGYSDFCESLLSGSGTGTFSGGVSGTVRYSRVAASVTYTGHLTVGGRHLVHTWHCAKVKTSVNPVSTYVKQCVVVTVL